MKFRRELPFISRKQMIDVDKAMITEMGISLVQMMENAGLQLARLARRRFLDKEPGGKKVVVLAGRGGNGGGALAAARHLANWGAKVQIFLTHPLAEFEGAPGQQLQILISMTQPVTAGVPRDRLTGANLILDGMIGYSFGGRPSGTAAVLIRWANAEATPVLSLDLPSGLDADTGEPGEPCVKATATLTLALPKMGQKSPSAAGYMGDLYLADISVPPIIYAQLGIDGVPVDLFAKDEIVRLR